MHAWIFAFLGLFSALCVSMENQAGLPLSAVDRLGLGVPTKLALSQDERYLAVASAIGVEIRDAKTLELLDLLAPHEAWTTCVAFSPDGDELAAGFENGKISVWHTETRRKIQSFSLHEVVTAIAWSKNGELAVATGKGNVYLVDLGLRLVHSIWTNPDELAVALAFLPSGDLALLTEKSIRILARPNWEERWSLFFATLLRTVIYLPENSLLVAGGCLYTLDAQTGKTLWSKPISVTSAGVSKNGTYVVLAQGPSLLFLHLQSGKESWIFSAHEKDIKDVAVGQTRAFSLGDDGRIRIWDLETKSLSREVKDFREPIFSLAVSPSGMVLASGSDECVRVWNLEKHETHTLKHRFSNAFLLQITETTIIVVDLSGAHFLNIQTGDRVGFLPLRASSALFPLIRPASLSSDGERVAWMSPRLSDKSFRILVQSVSGQKLLETRVESEHPCIDLNSTGKLLAISTGPQVELWDIDTQTRILSMNFGDWETISIKFSPNRPILAVALIPKTPARSCLLKIWGFETGHVLTKSFDTWITALSFSPDGNKVAVGTIMGDIFVLDITKSWLPIVDTLEGHTSTVWALAFSPSGDRLFSSSNDGTILIFAL